MTRWRLSRTVALIAVFAAFTVVCDSIVGPFIDISGVWFSWIFVVEPINGFVLGPFGSLLSTFIGTMIGHSVYIRGSPEFLFAIGAPMGAMITSLLFRGKWKIPLLYYTTLLGAYLVTPVSWELPFWGMWDVYLAFGVLIILVVFMKRLGGFWNSKLTRMQLLRVVPICALIGLEADVLMRIFILIPCHAYRFIYQWDAEVLKVIWGAGAVETSLKVAVSILVSVIVSPSIIRAVQEHRPESRLSTDSER